MNTQPVAQRLQSLDFFRGLIMVLLALEGARLYDHLFEGTDNPVFVQFFHHPWNGLRFWDLIQPGFMFIAGVGMALSLTKQYAAGVPWTSTFTKTLVRSGCLFFWGVLSYAVRPGGLSFELWNVLTQLSVTMLIAFLIFNWSIPAQLIVSIGLLLLTECLYRFTNIPGFDQPFTDQQNFGNYIDLVLMHKVNDGGWVAINCIPTAAHTIWGAVAGKLILSAAPDKTKIRYLLTAGIIGLLLGYSMDVTITPIIKRISTSSFVLASGGWCLLMLALCYWWIDVKKHQRHLLFFTVIGMNSIFIYLFIEIPGPRWFNDYFGAVSNGLMQLISVPTHVSLVVTSLLIFALEWGMCYFLSRKKIFFRL